MRGARLPRRCRRQRHRGGHRRNPKNCLRTNVIDLRSNDQILPFHGVAFNLGVNLVQPLYTFGKIESARAAAKAGIDNALAQVKKDRADVTFNTGGIVTQEAAIHVSNLRMLVDPKTKKRTRVGLRWRPSRVTAWSAQTRVRFSKHSHQPASEMTDLMPDTKTKADVPPPRLKLRYREEIAPALREEFSFANVMQVPTVTKVIQSTWASARRPGTPS